MKAGWKPGRPKTTKVLCPHCGAHIANAKGVESTIWASLLLAQHVKAKHPGR